MRAFAAPSASDPLYLPGLANPVVGIKFDKVKINSSSARPVFVALECLAQSAISAAVPNEPAKSVRFATPAKSEVELDSSALEESLSPSPEASHVRVAPKIAAQATFVERRIMVKPEDVRKDQVILRIIRLVEFYLQQAGEKDIPVVSYTATPMSTTDGVIEMVPDSSTLAEIASTRDMSISKFLKNINEPRLTVQRRFANSYAVSTVMMFLLVRHACVRMHSAADLYCAGHGRPALGESDDDQGRPLFPH